MTFEFETWDDGRLTVNRDFAPILRHNRLTTFDALLHYEGGRIAKNLLRERTTTRIVLMTGDETQIAFYLKRHAPPPWKEYVKPWLRLTRPILGARNEWQAILRFHEAGIPTMVPVALGESRRHSFLMTRSIEGCTKLSEWTSESRVQSPESRAGVTEQAQIEQVVDSVARMARTMHVAGLHHQDFYLTHLLLSDHEPHNGDAAVYVIDLGRVRHRRQLSQRWIVKDLAQLNYSAPQFSETERRQFLETYFGRPLTDADADLIRRIQRKTAAIARHSRKNGL